MAERLFERSEVMIEYRPNKWVVLKITKGDEVAYKVLGGWKGGYLDGDHWRMNSGIVQVDVNEQGDYFYFKGHSGSIYGCHKESYGFTSVTAGLYKWFCENHTIEISAVELMPEETDWLKLI